MSVKEAGYIFVYLSYEDESNNYVYFDDFKVTHTKSNILQANEYYPFGMQTANSWTRENVTGNNYLANGSTELNSVSSLYDLDYRNYDPILGRMHQVDPVSDKYGSLSPYNYSYNDPVGYNDLNGADPAHQSVYEYIQLQWQSNKPLPFMESGFDGGSGSGGTGGNSWSYSMNISIAGSSGIDVSKFMVRVVNYWTTVTTSGGNILSVKREVIGTYNEIDWDGLYESLFETQGGLPTAKELHDMYDDSFASHISTLTQEIIDNGWSGKAGQKMVFNEVYKTGYNNVLSPKDPNFFWKIDLLRVTVGTGRVDLQTASNPYGFVDTNFDFGETPINDVPNYNHQAIWMTVINVGGNNTYVIGWTFTPLIPK